MIMVDCSHANSNKDHTKQGSVLEAVAEQIASAITIRGVMLESNLKPGNQKVDSSQELQYGVSITDACIGWEETERLLKISTKHYLSFSARLLCEDITFLLAIVSVLYETVIGCVQHSRKLSAAPRASFNPILRLGPQPESSLTSASKLQYGIHILRDLY